MHSKRIKKEKRLAKLLFSSDLGTYELKRLTNLIDGILSNPGFTKKWIKKLVLVWSQNPDQALRVLAFINLVKIQQKSHSFLPIILGRMYLNYRNNVKFVNKLNVSSILVMQENICGLLNLDLNFGYKQAFTYIQSFAVVVRMATTLKEKKYYEMAYTWKFIKCLELWVKFVTKYPSDLLDSLLFPLVNIITSLININLSQKWLPFHLHCLNMLNTIAMSRNSIALTLPVLPLCLLMLQQIDFNKKSVNVGKDINIMLHIKFQKIYLPNVCFESKECFFDRLFDIMLDYLSYSCHQWYFPEFCIPFILELSDFSKKCKVLRFCKPIKNLLQQINYNNTIIIKSRLQVHEICLQPFLDLSCLPFLVYYKKYKILRKEELKEQKYNEDDDIDESNDSIIDDNNNKHLKRKLVSKTFVEKRLKNDH